MRHGCLLGNVDDFCPLGIADRSVWLISVKEINYLLLQPFTFARMVLSNCTLRIFVDFHRRILLWDSTLCQNISPSIAQ